jgi:hypothetical protein
VVVTDSERLPTGKVLNLWLVFASLKPQALAIIPLSLLGYYINLDFIL